MTTDVRTLLHDAAEAPSRAPDIDAARRRARERRRRRSGLGSLVVVTVLALATGAFALASSGGGDDNPVAIGLRQSSPGVPDGWQTIRTDRGISLAVPSDWKSQPANATPIGDPVVSVGDLTPDADSVLVACTTGGAPSTPPTAAGSGVNVWEFPAGSVQVPGTANDTLQVIDRPESFAGALIRGAPVTGTPCTNARYDQVAFSDAGRVFMVRVVTVFPSAADEEARMALAAQVLDTLRIEPLAATTTTPVASVQPDITIPTTTAAPFVPTTQDEIEIVDLVDRWLYAQPDDGVRATIVDADSILDLIHKGMKQYEANLPDGYTGKVESLKFSDATHADMVFTLDLHGSALYPHQLASIVKVDGRWMMTRKSECDLLAHGSLICPAE